MNGEEETGAALGVTLTRHWWTARRLKDGRDPRL